MVRVKGGTRTKERHNKVLKMAKGYWMSRSKQFRKANETLLHAGEYAFAGRKRRKRDMRSLWIVRLNAALGKFNIKYNTFIHSLKENKIELDRKILSYLAVEQPKVFEQIVQKIKKMS